MTPIEQLAELAADLDTVGRPDHSARLRSIIVELRRELSETGVRVAWAAVVDALYEARPDWDETDGKSSMENAVAAIRSMAAQCSAQILPDGHYFAAWRRVALTLGEVRPQWRNEATGPSAVDSAVAAIRSMAAQCSAQELQSLQAQLTPPAGVPQGEPEPVQGLLSLYYATGYMRGCGRPDVASDLERIGEWLRTNAPQE